MFHFQTQFSAGDVNVDPNHIWTWNIQREPQFTDLICSKTPLPFLKNIWEQKRRFTWKWLLHKSTSKSRLADNKITQKSSMEIKCINTEMTGVKICCFDIFCCGSTWHSPYQIWRSRRRLPPKVSRCENCMKVYKTNCSAHRNLWS